VIIWRIRISVIKQYKSRYKNELRNNSIEIKSNAQAIIEWCLQGFTKKTRLYLFKHSSFVLTKKQWKSEMICHYLITQQIITRNHPLLSYVYLHALTRLPFCETQVIFY